MSCGGVTAHVYLGFHVNRHAIAAYKAFEIQITNVHCCAMNEHVFLHFI